MFMLGECRLARLALHLAILVFVFLMGMAPAYAADAISQGIQQSLEARQRQLAFYGVPPQPVVSAPQIGKETASEEPSSITALQEQIYNLQKEIAQLQTAQQTAQLQTAQQTVQTQAAQQNIQFQTVPPLAPPQMAPNAEAEKLSPHETPASAGSAASGGDRSSVHDTIKQKTGVDVTLGGFFDATTIYRSKNESADITSNLNTGVPFNNVANAHQSEYRETARGTRVTLKVEGEPDKDTKLGAWLESDFNSAASTATSTSTNSYTPRLYQGYLTYDRSDWGFHALAGQAFSLLTMNKTGILPDKVNNVLTIDPSYVAGFNYTRNPQLRVVEDFDDKKLWLGLSAESPQAVTSGLPCTANAASGTCSGFNSTYSVTSAPNSSSFANPLSTDTAPDIIMKLAYDPGWGHYEVFGITRFFHDNVGTSLHNNVYVGGGGGGSMILPVVAKYLSLQAQFMMGNGIGRYGPTQMPDFAIMPDGALKPIHEQTAMVGAVGHPTSTWDAYLYAGEEKVFRENSSTTAYGYGDFGTSNSGCYTPGGTCSASTSSVDEIILGFWKRFYEGNYGKMQAGMQNSILRRNAFSDASGNAPHAYEDIAMLSFRYYPF